MKKDIYDLLNDGDFNEESYKDINKFNDIEAEKIVSFVKKNSARKKKISKSFAIGAAACVLGGSIFISGVGSSVMAQIKEKFNPAKNYAADYAEELNESANKNGVEVKLEECSRSMFNITLRYTMTFNGGVPESAKSEVYQDSSLEFAGAGSYKYKLYRISKNCNVLINGVKIDENFDYLSKQNDIGIVDTRDLEITDKSITKELSISVMKRVIDKDINVKIQYDNLIDNKGQTIAGPWTIEHTFKTEEKDKDVKKVELKKPYEYTFKDGTYISFKSFSNTNTGLKLYGVEKDKDSFHAFMLKGTDNLGNEVILFPLYITKGLDSYKEYDIVYSLMSYGKDNSIKIDENTTEVKLKLYYREDNENKYYPAGEEFTVNLK